MKFPSPLYSPDGPAASQPADAGPAPPAGEPPSVAGGAPPEPPKRPDWLPEAHWDPKANAIKEDFGAHYGELAAFHKAETDRKAALPKKADEVKIEIKLPDTVKVPEGLDLKINDKDPRVPFLREYAVKHGLSQEAVSELVALDAQSKIENHNAELARLVEENKKLGEKGDDRKKAVGAWAKGLHDKKELTDGEFAEVRLTATTADGVTLLEKLMAKAAGSVPGTKHGDNPTTPEPKSIAERMYPNLPSGLPPASARSA